jgi:DNA primase
MPLATVKSIDPDVAAVVNYVINRGLSQRDLWFYRLGASNEARWRRRVIVPSFSQDGTINHYVARAIDAKRAPKYDGPDNVRSHELIFNELHIDWSNPLVICEGPFDLMKCGFNATCLLGSSLNESSALFESILMHKTPVLLALDSDMPSKVQQFSRKLAEYDVEVSVVSLGVKHDPGEMSRQEFQDAVSQAKRWSWHEMIASRLSRIHTKMCVA